MSMRGATLPTVLLLLGLSGCGGSGGDSEDPAVAEGPRDDPPTIQTAAGFPEPHFVDTNGIRMAVYEMGEGFPVVFAHGFPELAYSWRQQLPALSEAGFRAIAPDQRG